MSRHLVAFAAIALTGAALVLSEPATAAGGLRAGPGGFRASVIISRHARTIQHAQPRLNRIFRSHGIPPSAHGFATTTPLHVHTRFARRHHGIYHSGWIFPATYGDDGTGYIGTPYDPSEAIPVYGPAPADETINPAPTRTTPTRTMPAGLPRVTNATDENHDACRSERVKVPAAEGEREITVVRC